VALKCSVVVQGACGASISVHSFWTACAGELVSIEADPHKTGRPSKMTHEEYSIAFLSQKFKQIWQSL